MPRPKRIALTLKEQIERIVGAGLNVRRPMNRSGDEDDLTPLPDRIRSILGIVRHRPQKYNDMNYLVLYDIEDNKVRKVVAKFLERKGCLRIQKSVFMANTEQATFQEIYNSLREINGYYENRDSIILVPVNVADVRSMRLIGNNVNIDILTDPPNTMFF